MQPHSAIAPMIFFMLFFIFGLITCAFWVWMIIDCATNPGLVGNEKLIWVLIVLLAHFLGALIYFFVARPKRYQSGSPPLIT